MSSSSINSIFLGNESSLSLRTLNDFVVIGHPYSSLKFEAEWNVAAMKPKCIVLRLQGNGSRIEINRQNVNEVQLGNRGRSLQRHQNNLLKKISVVWRNCLLN